MRTIPARREFRPILQDAPTRLHEGRLLKFIGEELALQTRILMEWLMPAIDDLRAEMQALVQEANLTRDQVAATGAVLDKLHTLVVNMGQATDLSEVQAMAQEAQGIFAQARADLNARTTADDVSGTDTVTGSGGSDTPPASGSGDTVTGSGSGADTGTGAGGGSGA